MRRSPPNSFSKNLGKTEKVRVGEGEDSKNLWETWTGMGQTFGKFGNPLKTCKTLSESSETPCKTLSETCKTLSENL